MEVLLNVVCKFSDKLKTSLQNSVTLNLIISITSFPVVNHPSYIIRLYTNSSFLISTNVISSAWKSLFTTLSKAARYFSESIKIPL